MQLITIIFGILFLHFNLIYGQIDENLIRQKVLESNIVDSVFIFGDWTVKKEEEEHIKFLGQVNAHNGECYKVMTSMLV